MKTILLAFVALFITTGCETLLPANTSAADLIGDAYVARTSQSQQNIDLYRAKAISRDDYAKNVRTLNKIKKGIDAAYKVYTAGGTDAQVKEALTIADGLLSELALTLLAKDIE